MEGSGDPPPPDEWDPGSKDEKSSDPSRDPNPNAGTDLRSGTGHDETKSDLRSDCLRTLVSEVAPSLRLVETMEGHGTEIETSLRRVTSATRSSSETIESIEKLDEAVPSLRLEHEAPKAKQDSSSFKPEPTKKKLIRPNELDLADIEEKTGIAIMLVDGSDRCMRQSHEKDTRPDKPSLWSEAQYTRELCRIIHRSLDVIISMTEDFLELERSASYRDVILKLECAKTIFETPDPDDDLKVPVPGHPISTKEIAVKVVQATDEKADEKQIYQGISGNRRCRLKTLAGLSLFYSKTGTQPDWDLLARLWFDSLVGPETVSHTSVFQVLTEARVPLSDQGEQDKVLNTISRAARKARGKPEIAYMHSLVDKIRSREESRKKKENRVESIKPKFAVMDSTRAIAQAVNLAYYVAQLASSAVCQLTLNDELLSASSTTEERTFVPTYGKLRKLKDPFHTAIPQMVTDAVNAQLREGLSRTGKLERKYHYCPHDPYCKEGTPWIEAKGAMDPSFSAIVFVGPPTLNSRVMIINEEKVFGWMNKLLQYDRSKKEEGVISSNPAFPNAFLNIDELQKRTRITSMEGVHSLKINSTGQSSYLCYREPHETQMWHDALLPIDIRTCSLGHIHGIEKL